MPACARTLAGHAVATTDESTSALCTVPLPTRCFRPPGIRLFRGRRERYARANRGADAERRLDGDVPADHSQSLAHADQARARARRHLCGIEPATAIDDL